MNEKNQNSNEGDGAKTKVFAGKSGVRYEGDEYQKVVDHKGTEIVYGPHGKFYEEYKKLQDLKGNEIGYELVQNAYNEKGIKIGSEKTISTNIDGVEKVKKSKFNEKDEVVSDSSDLRSKSGYERSVNEKGFNVFFERGDKDVDGNMTQSHKESTRRDAENKSISREVEDVSYDNGKQKERKIRRENHDGSFEATYNEHNDIASEIGKDQNSAIGSWKEYSYEYDENGKKKSGKYVSKDSSGRVIEEKPMTKDWVTMR